jgi:alkanesulfonate monooxygenase SsuD/methylene tetrahydromethanopterin reductase-like flavin-dependent oxidoreductase (luciferase family)
VISAATTRRGVRLAAASGAGIMLDGMSPLSWSQELAAHYRAAYGRGPVVLSRRVWVGDPPTQLATEDQANYHAFTAAAMRERMEADDSMIADPDPTVVADQLRAARAATQADTLSIRLHLPGGRPHDVRVQLERLGADVLPRLRP